MARAAAKNSTWVGELLSDVSIGGTSSSLASVVGTNWPSGAGIFGIQIGEDPDDDAELVQVTRSGAVLTNDASTPTFTKAHTAGVSIYYLTTAEDINAKPDDSVVIHTTGAESKAGVLTLTSQMKAKGAYSALGYYYPSIFFADSGEQTGIQGGASAIDLVVGGGVQAQYGLGQVAYSGRLLASAGLGFGMVRLDYDPGGPVDLTGLPMVGVDTANTTVAVDLYLPDPSPNGIYSAGTMFLIGDIGDNAATYNVNIYTSAGTIEGGAGPVTISTSGQTIIFINEWSYDFTTGNWRIWAIT